MKTTKKQLRNIIKESLAEGYNSMSSAGKALAQRAKRQFAKDYPDIRVGIDGREGWITVDGKKAVNMSQASGSPLSMEDVVDEMKKAYLGHPVQEVSKMKITKRQLRKIIKEVAPPPHAEADGEYNDPAVNDAGQALFVMVDDLVTSMKRGRVSAEALNDGEDGEIYIMTGQAEGITVKVMRRGR